MTDFAGSGSGRPLVLVVDDSGADRKRAAGLLRHRMDVEIAFAAHGGEALDFAARRLPDVVVTDLQMPGLDGLGLVEALKDAHPEIPVVLMTGHGSEKTAVTALRSGAASYVPKAELATELVPTVRNVLGASHARREADRLLACAEETLHRFDLPNDPRLFPQLVALVRDQLERRRLLDENARMQVCVAFDEALSNALHHGNLEVDSALREQGVDVYFAETERRASQPPYRDRRLHVTVSLRGDEARIVVRDEGPGFDPKGLPDPRAPENVEKASGRGLFLIRTFMDEVTFNDSGNQITMVKRTAPPA